MTDHDSCILSVTHGDRRLNTRVSHDNTKTTRFVRAAAHDDDDDDDDDDEPRLCTTGQARTTINHSIQMTRMNYLKTRQRKTRT